MKHKHIVWQLRSLRSCLTTIAWLWSTGLEHPLTPRSLSWLVVQLLWMIIFSSIWLVATLVITIGYGQGTIKLRGLSGALWYDENSMIILDHEHYTNHVKVCQILDGICFYMPNTWWNLFLYAKYLLEFVFKPDIYLLDSFSNEFI